MTMTPISPLSALTNAAPLPALPEPNAGTPAAVDARNPRFAEAIRAAAPAAERAALARSAGEEFEAVALTTFVQHMLPKDDSIVWGGEGGRLWRGVFAQHLASEVAATGGIGIADLINTMLEERKGDRS